MTKDMDSGENDNCAPLRRIRFEPDIPPYKQVVFEVKKQLLLGTLDPGTLFPSVRTLSKSMKISKVTAGRVIRQLESEGLLTVLPGVGTVLSSRKPKSGVHGRRALAAKVERIVVEAKYLELDLDQITETIEQHWTRYPSMGRSGWRQSTEATETS
jgi:DNA-binding transcriptional regulator YhcF (GntR family)